MSSPNLHVPRIRMESDRHACVTRWGHAGGFVYRAGDRLVLAEPDARSLLLLTPRGYGNPMLGRQVRGRLVAEPGGVPALPSRWTVAGRVTAVERDLERAVTGGGRWCVEVVLRPLPHATLRDLQLAERRYQGGCLSGAELDALCLRAAVAEDELAVRVSVGAAESLDRAAALAEAAGPGTVRLEVDRGEREQAEPGRVIEGPWSQRPQPVGAEPAQMQLALFGDIRHRHAN